MMGGMTWYARPSWRLVRQLIADAFVAAWLIGWWFAGRLADATVRALAGPVRQAAQSADELRRQVADAAVQTASIPYLGQRIRQPFDAMAASLADLGASASAQAAGIEQAATVAGAVVFALPALLAVALWLPARLRFARRAAQARSLASDPGGTPLLALRALSHARLDELTAIAPDPAASWRAGDPQVIGRLAALELARAGVWGSRRPREAVGDAG